MIKIGDEIEAKFTNVDRKNRSVALSIKASTAASFIFPIFPGIWPVRTPSAIIRRVRRSRRLYWPSIVSARESHSVSSSSTKTRFRPGWPSIRRTASSKASCRKWMHAVP